MELRIHGVGPDCDRLKQRLAALGIDFAESHRAMDQPITEQSALTVVYDINIDETIIRAACKIGFNYAAKILGCVTVRRVGFDAARRFVRYGEAPVRLATVQQLSVLVGPDAVERGNREGRKRHLDVAIAPLEARPLHYPGQALGDSAEREVQPQALVHSTTLVCGLRGCDDEPLPPAHARRRDEHSDT